jgi:hypothetical protein
VPDPLAEEDDCGGLGSAAKRWIAWELASTEAYNVLTAAARVSKVALRSALSPMVAERGMGDDVEAECGDSGEVERTGEEHRDRDTRLSRASSPRVGGP